MQMSHVCISMWHKLCSAATYHRGCVHSSSSPLRWPRGGKQAQLSLINNPCRGLMWTGREPGDGEWKTHSYKAFGASEMIRNYL